MKGIKPNEGRTGVIPFDICICLYSILFNISDSTKYYNISGLQWSLLKQTLLQTSTK